MTTRKQNRSVLQLEVLEARFVPSANHVFFVVPPEGGAAPQATVTADQGCVNGIDAHATGASDGVVNCGQVG